MERPKADTARLRASGHALSLAIVAAGCVIGQVAILTRRPLAFELPDSGAYIVLGMRLMHQPSLMNLFDAYRTPGYPALLALVGGLQGAVGRDGIVYVQAALMVLTALELYVLTFGRASSRVAATAAAFLFATNVRLLDWERLVMTESPAIFLVTTMLLAFWLWLRTRATRWAILLAASSALGMLTRPSLLYLPACLLAIVLIAERRRWLPVAVVLVAAYAPVVGYSLINEHLNPHAGLSAVGNINLLGKVLEYGMQGDGDRARFPTLAQAIGALSPGDRDPYNLLLFSSDAMGPNYSDAATFSVGIFERHPLDYLEKSAADFARQWLLVPYAYIPPGSFQALSQALASYALVTYAAYPALPLAVIALIVFWPRLDREVALGIVALPVAVAGSLATTALFSYVDFARLKTPVDALALVAVIAIAARVANGAISRPPSPRL
ncbi:MAG TPA: glycosyltransferase family 39 protein [Patescibacteria group bacterium]|nr:glycosyltransferase family 39 protein [Patescibacteria group bacterium]